VTVRSLFFQKPNENRYASTFAYLKERGRKFLVSKSGSVGGTTSHERGTLRKMPEGDSVFDRVARSMKGEPPAAADEIALDFVSTVPDASASEPARKWVPVQSGRRQGPVHSVLDRALPNRGVLGRVVQTTDALEGHVFGGVSKTVSIAGDIAGGISGGVTGGVVKTLSGMRDGVQVAASGITGGITGGVRKTVDGVADGMQFAARDMINSDGLQSAVHGVSGGVQEAVRGAKKINGVSSAVSVASGGVVKSVSGVSDNVQSAVRGVMEIDGVSSAVNVASGGVQSAVSGGTSIASSVMDAPLVSNTMSGVNAMTAAAVSSVGFGVGFAFAAPPAMLQQAPVVLKNVLGMPKNVLDRVLSSEGLQSMGDGSSRNGGGSGRSSAGRSSAGSSSRNGNGNSSKNVGGSSRGGDGGGGSGGAAAHPAPGPSSSIARAGSLTAGPPLTQAQALATMQKVLLDDGDVRVAPLLVAVKRCYLVSLEALGGWTYIAAREIKTNLEKVEKCAAFLALSAAPNGVEGSGASDVRMLALFEHEASMGIHQQVRTRDGGRTISLADSSAAMAMLWLLRFLSLWTDVWAEPRAKTFASGLDASYTKHCAPYHGWVTQRAFALACSIVPTWESSAATFSELDPDGEVGVMRNVAVLQPVLACIDAALKARGWVDPRVV
jgi:hypothetical protein